jgi:hypothetical protein
MNVFEAIEVDTSAIIIESKKFEEAGRKALAILFEKKFKNTVNKKIASLIVDDGRKRNKDYYLGAEKMALKAFSGFHEIKAYKYIKTWIIILGYISWRLITVENEQEPITETTDKNKTPPYVS